MGLVRSGPLAPAVLPVSASIPSGDVFVGKGQDVIVVVAPSPVNPRR